MRPSSLAAAIVICTTVWLTGCANAQRSADVSTCFSPAPAASGAKPALVVEPVASGTDAPRVETTDRFRPQPVVPSAPAADVGHAPGRDAALERRLAADPVGFLRDLEKRCAALEQYTLTFTRSERRGLFQTLRGPEVIFCKFRREPFSVYMKWLDPDVKYGESVFVEGEHDNEVRFVPRHGLFGLPPGVTAVKLQTPVTWGEARKPMTAFGLERLMEQTLDSIDNPQGQEIIEYRGVTTIPQHKGPVHQLYLQFPGWKGRANTQFLYIDADSGLPAGTVLSYPDGKLDASYFYDDIDTQAQLTDEDFVLEAERRE